MQIETVIRLDDPGSSAFRRTGMAAHGIHFRYQRNLQFRVALGDGNRGPQTSPARTNDRNVSVNLLHTLPLFKSSNNETAAMYRP
jgi:hypothetical protein